MTPERITPECPECGTEKPVDTAVVGQADEDGDYPVQQYDLECGHTVDDPDALLGGGVVQLLLMDSPGAIEVRGGGQE